MLTFDFLKSINGKLKTQNLKSTLAKTELKMDTKLKTTGPNQSQKQKIFCKFLQTRLFQKCCNHFIELFIEFEAFVFKLPGTS